MKKVANLFGYFFYQNKNKKVIGNCLQNYSNRLLYRYKVTLIVYYIDIKL